MRTELILLFLGTCLTILFAVILLMKFILGVYMPFVDDRDFIRMEIVRSHGNERIHWEHELKRLYLRRIPLIGKYLARRYRKRTKR